jgi:hypothetical protein
MVSIGWLTRHTKRRCTTPNIIYLVSNVAPLASRRLLEKMDESVVSILQAVPHAFFRVPSMMLFLASHFPCPRPIFSLSNLTCCLISSFHHFHCDKHALWLLRVLHPKLHMTTLAKVNLHTAFAWHFPCVCYVPSSLSLPVAPSVRPELGSLVSPSIPSAPHPAYLDLASGVFYNHPLSRHFQSTL